MYTSKCDILLEGRVAVDPLSPVKKKQPRDPGSVAGRDKNCWSRSDDAHTHLSYTYSTFTYPNHNLLITAIISLIKWVAIKYLSSKRASFTGPSEVQPWLPLYMQYLIRLYSPRIHAAMQVVLASIGDPKQRGDLSVCIRSGWMSMRLRYNTSRGI